MVSGGSDCGGRPKDWKAESEGIKLVAWGALLGVSNRRRGGEQRCWSGSQPSRRTLGAMFLSRTSRQILFFSSQREMEQTGATLCVQKVRPFNFYG